MPNIGLYKLHLYMDVHIKKIEIAYNILLALRGHVNKDTISTRKMERKMNIIFTLECFLLLLMCRKKLLQVI